MALSALSVRRLRERSAFSVLGYHGVPGDVGDVRR
jgi:hypothetical protein